MRETVILIFLSEEVNKKNESHKAIYSIAGNIPPHSTDRSTHKTQLKFEKLDTFQLHYILAKNINNYIAKVIVWINLWIMNNVRPKERIVYAIISF